MKLTAKQRAAFFAGAWPELAGEGKCPIETGYVHHLSSRVSFEVLRVHRTKKGGWKLHYRVVDDREQRFFMLPTARSLQTDEHGAVLPMPPEEEIGYTRNPQRARADPVPSVPPNIQNVLVMRARLGNAEYEQEQRSDRLAERQSKHLANKLRRLQLEAAKHGVDLAPRLVGMIREAEAEIAAKRAA